MSLTDVQIAVLRAIEAARAVSPVEQSWAVGEGYAVPLIEGDMGLTSAGQEMLASNAGV
ncbi:hypothetical protein [Stenotrophomonas sp.]|uniref:hypothetical protein n=1 Tax=Stenotrophomonas sp. TaxID=69392 RepID=UPI0031CE6072